MRLEEFRNNIKNYGGAIKLNAVRNGSESTILKSFTSIEDIEDGYGSLLSYFEKKIEETGADQLIVTVKKPNGSAWHKPKHFFWSKPIASVPVPAAPSYPKNLGTTTIVENRHRIHPDAMEWQITTLKEQVKDLKEEKKSYKKEAKRYKALYHDIKIDMTLIERQHELDAAMGEVENQKSLAGVIEKVQPMLEPFLKSIVAKRMGQPQQSLSGVQGEAPQKAEPTQLFNIGQILKMISESEFSIFSEFFFRFAQLQENQRTQMLENLRTSTNTFDEQVTEFLTIKAR